MQGLSVYELERLKNIRENDLRLDELGLLKQVAAPASSGKARKKTKRAAKPPPPTSIRKSARGSAGRASSTAAGAAGEIPTAAEVESVLAPADSRDVRPLPRANGAKRTLSSRQSALLESLEAGGACPLTPQEVAAVHAARLNLRGVGAGSGYQGRNTWEEKRVLLRDTAGVRRPSWLDMLARSVDFGKTAEARAQTLFALERAAAGLGLEYAGWPLGVGVLLGGVTEEEMHGVPLVGVKSEHGTAGAGGGRSVGGEQGLGMDSSDDAQPAELAEAEAAAAGASSEGAAEERAAAEGAAGGAIGTDTLADDVVPVGRLLTLGSDTESLRREGMRLESKWARDKGNGWVYNHCLNKLRYYQEALLLQMGEEPEGPTVEEKEEGQGC
eukprot:scaffold11351_cov141-Isochrysis_galbana.AAC.7